MRLREENLLTKSYIMNFKELGLCPPLLKAIEEMGYEDPRRSKNVNPPNFEGRDLVGSAQTEPEKLLPLPYPASTGLKVMVLAASWPWLQPANLPSK